MAHMMSQMLPQKATVDLNFKKRVVLFTLVSSLCFQNQLSGNLLRKFKNSNGWQKLWVVFTNFSLFFYKSHQVCCAGKDLCMYFGRSLITEGSLSAHRMTILWPASPCLATLSLFRPSRRTSTKITSSNSTSNRTCTTSDQRASTPMRGGSLKKGI